MREKLSCEIVQDLLPGYIDGLTSDETNQAVTSHLEECDECRKMYERMKSDEVKEKTSEAARENQDKKEIDYLKKIRRHNWFNIILAMVIVIAFFAAYAYWQIFQVGRLMSVDEMAYYQVEYDAKENQLNFQGAFKDSHRGYGRITVDDTDGKVNISVYSTPVTSSHANQFAWGYSAGATKISQLSVNGIIVWEEGEGINRKTAEIFDRKIPYIGDASASIAVADAIGIHEQFGHYDNELTTAEEPYDWRFIIRHPLKTEKKEFAKEVMFADACVLLAMIDNLDSVTWDYITDEGQEVVTITAEDASKYVGKDIKTCGQTVKELQHLLINVGLMLEENPYIETSPLGDGMTENSGTSNVPYGFGIRVEDQSDSDIENMRWHYYLDDTFLNSAFIGFGPSYHGNREKVTSHVIDTDFLGRRLTDEEVSRLTFGLIVGDKDGNEYIVCEKKKLAAKYGETYEYVLTGSFEEGFQLTLKTEE